MRLALGLSLAVLWANLSGCANERVNPPAENEYITVTIKVPDGLAADAVVGEYLSENCTVTYVFFGKDRTVGRSGFKEIMPVQVGQSDLFEAKVPKDGGSFCQWRLTELWFGVAYKDPGRFGRKVTNAGGAHVSVKLADDKFPLYSRATGTQEENLNVRREYYPWLSEGFSGGYKEEKISLLGERYLFEEFKAVHARHVYFEPVLHAGYLVRSVLPKGHQEEDCISITYPDGSGDTDFCSYPDFRKLQAIRLKEEK